MWSNEVAPPQVPEELLKYLDSLYPERCPDFSWSERKIYHEMGARSVVRYLYDLWAEQNRIEEDT